MNIEDIKVGEWYNVPFKVKEIKSGDIHLINGGIEAVCQPSELSVIGEASMPQYVRVDTSNDIDLRSLKDSPLALSNDEIKEFTEWLRQKAESAPKYDPCRRFRKGDKVRVVEWSGRNPVMPFMDCKVGDIGTVIKDEEATSFFVRLHLEGKYEKDMPYCHLELVTPVEEMEPYSVEEYSYYWHVLYEEHGGKMTVCKFLKAYHPHAKAAAEAERDRLNAEYRKERK